MELKHKILVHNHSNPKMCLKLNLAVCEEVHNKASFFINNPHYLIIFETINDEEATISVVDSRTEDYLAILLASMNIPADVMQSFYCTLFDQALEAIKKELH